MLKKIDASELKIGMFIHDLDCGWTSHPFLRNRFPLTTAEEIGGIRDAGIRGVVIDCNKGLDASNAPTLSEAHAETEAELVTIAARPSSPPRVPLSEIRTVMADARLGKAVKLNNVGVVVESITGSILRNPGALLSLLRIKDKDDYTFLHSVSVCALLVAFSRSRNMAGGDIYEAGMGGLLHDTGKAFVPGAILNKQGRLTEAEFDIIKRHPRDGYDMLARLPQISQTVLDITLHHHERLDGSGYPDRLAGDGISEFAQMAAIVDVYDAITSDRCYHKGMSAAEALRKMLEWSKCHFNPTLTQEFIRCIGIYPVGTLVRLESGRLGVVIEQHASSLLSPRVNVFFSTKSNSYIRPEVVDLSRPVGFGGGDRITSHECAETWKVNPLQFLGAC